MSRRPFRAVLWPSVNYCACSSRAQVLEQSRGELRGRAERAERDLDAAWTGLARIGRDAGTVDAPALARRRSGRASGIWAASPGRGAAEASGLALPAGDGSLADGR